MANTVNLNNFTMDQLLALKVDVDVNIRKKAAEEMAALEQKMAELKPFLNGQAPKSAKVKPAKVKPAKVKHAKTAKVKIDGRKNPGKAPVKFKDPESGKTWSGRGMTPIWLREYEAAGKKREVFSVH